MDTLPEQYCPKPGFKFNRRRAAPERRPWSELAPSACSLPARGPWHRGGRGRMRCLCNGTGGSGRAEGPLGATKGASERRARAHLEPNRSPTADRPTCGGLARGPCLVIDFFRRLMRCISASKTLVMILIHCFLCSLPTIASDPSSMTRSSYLMRRRLTLRFAGL